MSAIPHTIRRNEIYHFNYRLDDIIYRKTLKTDSPSLCRKHVSGIMAFINKTKSIGAKLEKSDIDAFLTG